MSTLIATQSVSSAPINTVAFSPDGSSLATGSVDSTVRVFNRSGEPGAQAVSAYSTPNQQVTKLAYSPNSAEIGTSAQDVQGSGGSVGLVGGRGLLGSKTFTGHTGRVSWVDFAPDGQTIASSALDLTARMWDISTGEQVQIFVGHDILPSSVATGVWCVRYAPDNKMLATSGSDGTARLWEISSGKQLRKIQAADGCAFSVAFSPDGSLLAASSEEGLIKVFDPSSGALIRTMAGHNGWVVGVEFSPDGSMIASAGYDGTARLWDAATGEPIDVMTRPDKVHDVAFSPDGRILANGGDDGTLKQYSI